MTLLFDARRSLRWALIVGAGLLAIDVAVYAFVVRPRVRAYENLESTRSAFDTELLEAERTKDALEAYHQRLGATEQNTDTFRKDVLGSKQEKSIEIQREITQIAIEFGIDPESVSYDNTDLDDDGLERFMIEIPLEGDYPSLRKFIARVEQSKSFLIVDRVNLSSTKEGGLDLLLSIGVTTYFDAPWLKELKKTEKPERRRA